MLHRAAQWITEWSFKKSEDKEEWEVVEYGIEIFLETIIKFAALMCIGAVIGRLTETLLVLAAFSGIRISAGGIHARTSAGCTGIMLLVVVVSLIAADNVLIPIWGSTVCFGISTIIVIRYSPNGSQANELLDKEEKISKQKWALLTVLFFCILSINAQYRSLILTAVFLEMATIIMAAVKEGERDVEI